MKRTNRKDLLVFIVVVLAVTYLKSVYFHDIYVEDNWQYHLFIFFGSNQLVNIIWLIPMMTQIFLISKKIYMEMCHFDLRYHSRNQLLKRVLLYFMKEHTLYVFLSIVIQISGLMVITGITMTWGNDMIAFILKYYIEVMFYMLLFICISLITSKFTISFVLEFFVLIMMIMFLKNHYIPVITLFHDCYFNYITIPCLIAILYMIKKIYISKDLLGGIKYDTKD